MADGLTTYQWVTLGLGCAGFVGTWVLGAFRLGRAVEQVKASVKEQIDDERDKIVQKIEALESRFETDQKAQDHNFGEVGAAMRQYIADVEKFGLKNYVQKEDFRDAIAKIDETIRSGNADIKADLKELQKQIVSQRR